MAKAFERVSDVAVEVNELALSLLGWEVQDFRARITSNEYDEGECIHKLAISGVFRYNEDDWTDCFSSRDYPCYPVMLLRSPALADEPSITAFWCSPKKGVARVSENELFVPSWRRIDHSDFRIEITAYDSIEAASPIASLPMCAREIPLEVEDETTRSAVRLSFDQIKAFTYGDDDRDFHANQGLIRASGRVLFGSPEELLADWVSTWRGEVRKPPTVLSKAPFSRPSPSLTFDIIDESGFLLDQGRGDIRVHVPVNAAGQVPSRNPSWLVDCHFSPENYSAPPSKVVVRIEDA